MWVLLLLSVVCPASFGEKMLRGRHVRISAEALLVERWARCRDRVDYGRPLGAFVDGQALSTDDVARLKAHELGFELSYVLGEPLLHGLWASEC